MLFPCHRPVPDELVIEIHDVVDIGQEDAVHRALSSLITGSGARTVHIDLRTPLVTAAMVTVLLRVRDTAHRRGTALTVVARRPLARKVFRICGVSRSLLVTATLTAARTVTRGCHHEARPPRPRDRSTGPARVNGTLG
ncbi:STAS domain-containing protein [Streptomyces sp. NPDC015131]|uniref:STAS domain-containing protein n=1 Tax=Streptomyces sp. NPDC015131 TaxID=3364941 RepID=UPI0036F5555F